MGRPKSRNIEISPPLFWGEAIVSSFQNSFFTRQQNVTQWFRGEQGIDEVRHSVFRRTGLKQLGDAQLHGSLLWEFWCSYRFELRRHQHAGACWPTFIFVFKRQVCHVRTTCRGNGSGHSGNRGEENSGLTRTGPDWTGLAWIEATEQRQLLSTNKVFGLG